MKYRVYLCKQCNRRRRIYRTLLNSKYHRYTCSQGHVWDQEILTTEKVGMIMQEVMLNKVKGLFERDDTFYKTINRR